MLVNILVQKCNRKHLHQIYKIEFHFVSFLFFLFAKWYEKFSQTDNFVICKLVLPLEFGNLLIIKRIKW